MSATQNIPQEEQIPQVGDIGTALTVQIKEVQRSVDVATGAVTMTNAIVDISTASVKQITIKRPDDTKIGPNGATLTTTGADGKMYWKTALTSDLNQKGDYEIQGYVEFPSGKWHTSRAAFYVEENL